MRVDDTAGNFWRALLVGEARRSDRTPRSAGYTEDELVMANHKVGRCRLTLSNPR
jgi:hypothetical protein